MHPEELKKQLHGITAISTTPFTEEGAFDAKGYDKYLRFVLDRGMNASNTCIVVAGSTGECGAMSTAERKDVLEFTIGALDGALPVIAGCNSTNIYEAVDLAQHAEAQGAAGVMALAPYYYPPRDQSTIYEFYKKLSSSIGIGILLYNNIEVMNVDTSLMTLERLKSIPNIVGIKECTPNYFKMTRDVQVLGDDVAVVNGHGEFLEPYAGLAGAAGFISSMGMFAPEKAVAIWNARSTGDYAEAKRIRDTMVPYMDLAVKYSGLGGESKVISLLKYAADLVGSHGGYPRLPSLPLTDDEKREIQETLASIGLIEAPAKHMQYS